MSLPDDSKYVVKTEEGPVCGYIDKVDGKSYYKFKKIPYARPPIGSLRFLPPLPIKPWDEELDCTQDAPLPFSYFVNNQIVGSEDCLYIEICTPKICTDKLLPVMFWIGGFSFICYMDSILDPKLIVEQDIVFVRCGYRMGPFGFLSINEFVAPGNNGLKDIVMALQWIQRNIRAFGGDPDNVTIFGISSGASLVHYMMLSPMASGLFHKAIIQSASAINNWSLEKNPTQPVIKLAKELKITKTDIVEIVKELKNVPPMDIMKACIELIKELQFGESVTFDSLFKPCIENEFESIPIFLSKSPAVILKSGVVNKVPFIIGVNNAEASVLDYLKGIFFDNYERKNENVNLLVPKSIANETLSNKISQKILDFYLDGEQTFREDSKQQYVQMMSDYYFLYNVNKTIRIQKQMAPECPLYYYIINYGGEWSVPKMLDFFNNSGHAAEIPFLFSVILPDGSLCKGSRDSMITRCRIIKMWTNFAKYGNPTPEENDPLLKITWDPVTSKDELNYLSISPNLTKGVNPFHERMSFWEQLHKENKFLRVVAHLDDIGVFW